TGDDARRGRNLHRLPGGDRAARTPRQPLPERSNPWVRGTPRADDRQHFIIAANVFVFGNPTPGTEAAAEPASKLTALSQLSLGRRDLADRGVPLQYAVGEDAVRVETLVTMALVVAFEGRQLPCLTGNPGGYPGFDHAQVSAMQFAPIGCA